MKTNNSNDMKTFNIKTEEVELVFSTITYEVEAKSEEEATEIVKNRDYTRAHSIDSKTDDYSTLTKEEALKYAKGEKSTLNIIKVEETETATLKAKKLLIEKKDKIEKEIEQLNIKINA